MIDPNAVGDADNDDVRSPGAIAQQARDDDLLRLGQDKRVGVRQNRQPVTVVVERDADLVTDSRNRSHAARRSEGTHADKVEAVVPVVAAIAAADRQQAAAVGAPARGAIGAVLGLKERLTADVAAVGFDETASLHARGTAGLRAVKTPVFAVAPLGARRPSSPGLRRS